MRWIPRPLFVVCLGSGGAVLEHLYVPHHCLSSLLLLLLMWLFQNWRLHFCREKKLIWKFCSSVCVRVRMCGRVCMLCAFFMNHPSSWYWRVLISWRHPKIYSWLRPILKTEDEQDWLSSICHSSGCNVIIEISNATQVNPGPASKSSMEKKEKEKTLGFLCS